MKHLKVLILFLALALLLSACGTTAATPGAPREPASGAAAEGTVPGVDPATGAWIGAGGSYRFAVREDLPDANALLLRDGALYAFVSEYDRGGVRYRFERGGETLFSLEGLSANIELLGQSEEGFWFHVQAFDGDWSARRELLRLCAPDGATLREIDVTDALPEGARGFFSALGLYRGLPWAVSSEAELLLFDRDGGVTQRVGLPGPFQRPLGGGDGALYLSEEDGQTQTLSRLENGSFTVAFSCPAGQLFPADGGDAFLLATAEGISRIAPDGTETPVVLYRECALALFDLSDLLPLGEGRYLCRTGSYAGTLEPAEPSELHPRTRLRFGYLGGGAEWFVPNLDEITAFNLVSQDYYIDLVDLSEGGALTDEQALARLNTALTNGSAPDMLSLLSWNSGNLSPFPYIRKGVFVDLAALIEQDEDMALDDIVIARALQNDAGGLYFLCSGVSIDSYLADYSRFGDRWGWTFDEYLEIDRTLSEGQMTFYNLTRDYFLRRSASAYMRSTVDWRAGTCEFDTPAFLALLNAARDLRETPEPEDPDEMIFWSPEHIFDGTQVTESAYITNVGDMAAAQRMRGVERLSFIGWPSYDGGCGSEFNLQSTFAILSTGAHIDGCWAFMKYSLTHPADFNLPVYRPALEERLAAAMRDPAALPPGNYTFETPLTEAEAAQFRELLGRVEHTSLYDETALGVILAECEPFFRGERSAEQTAALIQSRLSLYVSEQS